MTTSKKIWLQNLDTKIGQGQKKIEDLTGSATFCALPWIHIATRPNGDMRLCCVSNASGANTGDHVVGLIKKDNGWTTNFAHESLTEAFNSQYMKSVRKTFLAGEIPKSCTKCFEEESSGVVSKRLWEMYEWEHSGLDFKELIENTSEDGEVPHCIRYFDLRLGHTCNLKCVMCSPHDSSRWLEDYEKVMTTDSEVVIKQIFWDKEKFNNKWYENSNFWNEIYDQIPHIRQLYFAGGEPLMIKEHKRFLLEIIKRGYSKNISLRYNSNGVFVNQEMIDIWKNFKQVRFAFSIDAFGERNRYIRFPADWKDIEKALWLFDSSPDNIHCSIACTVQVLNIMHVIDFAKWKLSCGFKKINKFQNDIYESGGGIINLHLLYLPTFLSARILSKEDKEKIEQHFNSFKKWLWDNYRQDDNFWKHNPYGWKRWESILKFIKDEDASHLLKDFKNYINKLDNIRNTDAKKVFPELAHLF